MIEVRNGATLSTPLKKSAQGGTKTGMATVEQQGMGLSLSALNDTRLKKLEFAVFGDGNGHPGLVRRTDRIGRDLAQLMKLSWAIIALLAANLIKLFLG